MQDWNRETPWRQGFFLGKDAILALKLPDKENLKNAVVIIATHDCDLTQLPDVEPMLEVVIGCIVDTPDGNFTHTKNPRKLHIELKNENSIVFAEFLAKNKISIAKEDLAKFLPNNDLSLDVENINIFQRWLALRYRRSAFPDEFEKRLKSKPNKLDEKISDILRKQGISITAVFFDVDEGRDLPKTSLDDTYILDITIIYGDKPDYNTALDAAEKARDAIKTLFKNKLYKLNNDNWVDIELRDCEAMSDNALTYKQSTERKQWRLEHISLSETPTQATIE